MLASIRNEVSHLSLKLTAAAGLVLACGVANAQMPMGPGPFPGPTPAPSPPPVPVNEAPVLESFDIRGALDDYYVVEGTLSDERPESCTVYFSGALAGYCTYVRPDGSFSLSVELGPGEGGAVDAQAVDDAGNYSNVLSTAVLTE